MIGSYSEGEAKRKTGRDTCRQNLILILTSSGLEQCCEIVFPPGYLEGQERGFSGIIGDSMFSRGKIEYSQLQGVVETYEISMDDVRELRSRLENLENQG